MQKKVLILGGYGNTGFLIAKLLLQESDVQLVIAGRTLSRAQQTVDDLNCEFHINRVSSKQVDAADTNSLKAAFEDVNIVVVASSTIDYTRNVADLALEAGADYLDVQLSSPAKLAVLNSLREKIERKGRCFITDGGFHPGVPAAMVRYAVAKFDALEVANISAAFQLNMKEFPKLDFDDLFGERYCSPMFLEELRSLPKAIPSLNETGFYIAGFNWMTDYIIIPIAFAALKIFREKAKGPMGKFFSWGLRNFSKPPFGAILQLEANGLKDKKNSFMHVRLTHNDAYVLTAVPVVACLLQYLNGSIRSPGLWFQANLVEPTQFFRDMERLGVRVSIQIK